jgi:hypothetical protein
MPTSLVTAVAGAVASNVVGGLFNKKDTPAAPAPTVEPPTLMPDPMAQKAAERRKAAISLSRQLNTADTVLTGDNKLGA